MHLIGSAAKNPSGRPLARNPFARQPDRGWKRSAEPAEVRSHRRTIGARLWERLPAANSPAAFAKLASKTAFLRTLAANAVMRNSWSWPQLPLGNHRSSTVGAVCGRD